MISQPTPVVFVEPAVWLGGCHPLVEQLGSAGALAELGSGACALRREPVRDLPAFRRFLHDYQQRVLLPVELPAIHRAWQHASTNQLRELLALDRRMAREPRLKPLAEASQRVGQGRLRQFRALHDVRLVQRYLDALDRGDAHAWHTLVYGVTMWLFSLPLRPGLLGYGRQVTRGFIRAAAGPLRLTESERSQLNHELMPPLVAAVAALTTAEDSSVSPIRAGR